MVTPGSQERIVDAGCALLERQGLRALSQREVAQEARVSRGALQFHFPSPDDLIAAVLRAWARRVSRAVGDAAADAWGLVRTWKLCEAWSKQVTAIGIALEAMLRGTSERTTASEIALRTLRGWIAETRRSLQQAELRNELAEGTDVRALAFELHQLVWSVPWASQLTGPKAAAPAILAAVRARLCAVARDPSVVPQVPAHETERGSAGDGDDDLPYPRSSESWRLFLSPTDPLYQAFWRHEIMGDPRNFLCKPEITPEDVARAEAAARKARR